MQIKTFETEDYFGKYEFTKPYMISASDCESISIHELIYLGGGSLDDFGQTSLGYTPMEGSRTLREEISSLYRAVAPDQILVLGAPIEGIYVSMRAMLNVGDHVVVLSPAYDALANVAENISGNVDRWYLKNDGQKWSLDFDELRRLFNKGTKLLVINFPHNPTGFLPTQKDFEKIYEISEEFGVRVFADEIYRGLEYEDQHRLPSANEMAESSVSLSGVSKNLGLPGLRFGWLTIKEPELYQQILNWKAYTTMCSPQPLEYLGTMAIRAYPKLVRKNLDIISKNLILADEFFKRRASMFNWIRPIGGTISTFEIRNGNAEAYCHKLADQFGIVLLPIKFMGYADTHARIGLGRTGFSESLNAFERAIDSTIEYLR